MIFGLNTKSRKIRTRKTPNTDIFHEVFEFDLVFRAYHFYRWERSKVNKLLKLADTLHFHICSLWTKLNSTSEEFWRVPEWYIQYIFKGKKAILKKWKFRHLYISCHYHQIWSFLGIFGTLFPLTQIDQVQTNLRLTNNLHQ